MARRAAAVLLMLLLALGPASSSARADPAAARQAGPAASTGTVVVVQGAPGSHGFYLDGGGVPTVPPLEYGEVSTPVAVSVGRHAVLVKPVGTGNGAGSEMVASFDVNAGSRQSVVSYLGPDAAPQLSVVSNDYTAPKTGMSVLRFWHGAVTGSVDVRVDGKAVLDNVVNMSARSNANALVLHPGPHSVAINSSDHAIVLVRAQRVELAADTATSIYLLGGSPLDPQLSLLVQPPVPSSDIATEVLSATASHPAQTPTGVPSGTDGLADRDLTSHRLLVAIAALTVTVIGATCLLLSTHRHRPGGPIDRAA
jgi:hypothetical protein